MRVLVAMSGGVDSSVAVSPESEAPWLHGESPRVTHNRDECQRAAASSHHHWQGSQVVCVLTIAKMGAHSVTYYQSTVDENRGPDSYYSEDGKQPASVWLRGENVASLGNRDSVSK